MRDKGGPSGPPLRFVVMKHNLPLVAGAILATGCLLSPAGALAANQPAKAVGIDRIGPTPGRLIVKIRCAASTAQRASPMAGSFSVFTPAGDKVASGGFSCSGAATQFAYATIVGSDTEGKPGTSPAAKAIMKARKLTVRVLDTKGTPLASLVTLPIKGYALHEEIRNATPQGARSHGATDANQAPTLLLSATQRSIEKCAWTFSPRGGGENALSADPDGDALTISWFVDGKRMGRGPLLSRARLSELVHTFPRLGRHTVRVLLEDGKGASTDQTMVVLCVSTKPR
jgi:hypothetical protein